MGFFGLDIRYTAKTVATTTADVVLLPVVAIIRRPDAASALAEAKLVVEEFRKLCAESKTPSGWLDLADLEAAQDKHSGHLTVMQYSKREVRLDLEFLAVLRFAGPGNFWERSATLAWAADLIQQFCLRKWPKRVRVAAKRGRLLTDPEPKKEWLDQHGEMFDKDEDD